MAKYDLHMHSKYSDGELNISEIVKIAKEHNLDGIAITDHDNIDSWLEIDKNNYDLDVVKGVELSTYYKGENVHVLGYYLNDSFNYKDLACFLKDMSEKRKERVHKIIELLKPLGIEIKYENIEKFADGVIARPHIARAIIEAYPERNYTIDYIFEHFIGDNCPAFVKVMNFETEDAINLLHQNHCIAVLAHPLLLKKLNYKELLKLNFDGIEVVYPYKNNDFNKVKKEIKHDLLVTGGTDFHGIKQCNNVGKFYCDQGNLEKFLNVINK